MTEANWDLLKNIVNVISYGLQYALLPIFTYHFVISIFGWIKRKETPASKYAPQKSFAMLVAAHNEEIVIGNIVRNLKNVNYPKHLYDIFVIADNCTDNTAKIARENGAEVHERFHDTKKGKGFALEWMFAKVFNMEKKYDAICILDADNLVSPNFLLEMNKQLCKGHEVVQGYLDCKNPFDSWISGSYSIAFWLTNRLFQLPRYYLGLSCGLGGTGFIVSTPLLKEMGWGATCLTEDLEFTLRLALRGKKVYWSHEAAVYDEKPLTLGQSWRQRKRWMQGQADCASRYLKDLFKKTIKDRDIIAFDCAMYVLYPLVMVVNGASLLANIARWILYADLSKFLTLGTISSILFMVFVMYFSIVFLFSEGKVTPKIVLYFFLLPFYSLTWVPIIIQGFIDRDKTEWCHTAHTRAIEINELENMENAG